MPVKPALLIAALSLPIPLWAACPTGADLQTGIRFAVNDGASEVFRQARPGVVETLYTDSAEGTTGLRTVLGQGIYMIVLQDFVDGQLDPSTRATMAFPMAAADMPLPVPGESWQVEVRVTEPDGNRTETQTYTFGQTAINTIGGCEYRMIPIEVVYGQDAEGDRDYLYYLTDLGIAYFAGGLYDGKEDLYDYRAISVEP